ncbi:MAG: cytochrome b/b6 domain-containing protein, partial [Chloroflexota bacterium]|nr:cytochrome b/b6 domain-containing protein [Chloroflexota bacterium]
MTTVSPGLAILVSPRALFREGHALLTWGLFGLILLHIGAALHHGLIRRDGVLAGML